MQFRYFLFPESKLPDTDNVVINETLREAELCDALGFDVSWLAEHHPDGGCAYVDPLTFAAAIAAFHEFASALQWPDGPASPR